MRQGTGTNRPKTYTQTRNHTHPRMPNKHSHPTTNDTSPTHQKGGTPTECTKLRRLIAAGKRPDPSRNRKLSLPAPMILPNPGGKVGHRRTQIKPSTLQFRLEGRGICGANRIMSRLVKCDFSPFLTTPAFCPARRRIR